MLVFFDDARGAETVEDLLKEATANRCDLVMSVVNLGEVLYVTERKRGQQKVQDLLATMGGLPIRIIDADRAQTLIAANIKAHWPIAYADCFAAALAKIEGATVITGDPEFKQLDEASVVPVRWLVTR